MGWIWAVLLLLLLCCAADSRRCPRQSCKVVGYSEAQRPWQPFQVVPMIQTAQKVVACNNMHTGEGSVVSASHKRPSEEDEGDGFGLPTVALLFKSFQKIHDTRQQ
ncbi:hypothetical protein B0T16DRAFT_388089 [Cercophora newfieldiana]|uniref:Secreted protein n=1 Tax=Cercophora newfieldiana TaxID=92897 RepID=A0AA40CXJ5_9PEZI|nr:hypothetical protein B0T16DRAFT_388089 [Cercophora newfieldiana]